MVHKSNSDKKWQKMGVKRTFAVLKIRHFCRRNCESNFSQFNVGGA